MKIDTPASLCDCRNLSPNFTTPAEDLSLSETSFAACVRPVRTRENGGNGVGDVSLKKIKFAARLLHVIERDTRGDGVGDGSPLAF